MSEPSGAETELSSRITHSIVVRDAEPAIPFFQAQLNVAESTSSDVSEVILGEQDFTIWQQAPPTVILASGLSYTPP